MTYTNRERKEAFAEYRRRMEQSSQATEDKISGLLGVIGALVLAVVLGIVLWNRFAARDLPYPDYVVAECENRGMVATVVRGENGEVKGVRCNLAQEVK